MKADLRLNKPIYSSFLNSEVDIKKILKILFISSKPYSDILKRLLVINNPDCLDNTNTNYQKVIDNYSLKDLIDKNYIRLNPKIARGTHEEIKSYIITSLDNFQTNYKDPNYLEYNINFDIMCHNDVWVLDNYQIRPLVIAGYIDGILNSLSSSAQFQQTNKSNIKLSGVGEYQFLGLSLTVLNEDFSIYSLLYHGMTLNKGIQQIGSIKK